VASPLLELRAEEQRLLSIRQPELLLVRESLLQARAHARLPFVVVERQHMLVLGERPVPPSHIVCGSADQDVGSRKGHLLCQSVVRGPDALVDC
jgi:hypothetical protein